MALVIVIIIVCVIYVGCKWRSVETLMIANEFSNIKVCNNRNEIQKKKKKKKHCEVMCKQYSVSVAIAYSIKTLSTSVCFCVYVV